MDDDGGDDEDNASRYKKLDSDGLNGGEGGFGRNGSFERGIYLVRSV